MDYLITIIKSFSSLPPTDTLGKLLGFPFALFHP
jgi:hypothetical protein